MDLDRPYRRVIYDDGSHVARELTHLEQRVLEQVCATLGYDVSDLP